MCKFLNVYLIRSKHRKMFLSSQDICERIGITLDDWYLCINWTQKLPHYVVKELCEVLKIKESEIYL